MKKMFAKTTLALAVAGVMAAPAFAVDGYGYSGENARSKALQLNYFSYGDRGNVWVNPALAAEYGNSAEVTLRNGGSHTGGVFYEVMDGHTVGVYLGRPSTAKHSTALDFGSYDGYVPGFGWETGLGRNTGANPDNQFDVFYAMDMGEMAFGARLNFQARDRADSYPLRDNMTLPNNVSGDIVGANGININLGVIGAIDDMDRSAYVTEMRRRASAQKNVNDTSAVAADSGKFTNAEFSIRDLQTNSRSLDATEMNLTLGFNLKSMGIDGAVHLGTASGENVRSNSATITKYQINETGAAATHYDRVKEVNSFNRSEKTEVDGGMNIGLALRGLLMEGENSTLHASFYYSSMDYSGKLSAADKQTTTTNYFNSPTAQNTVTSSQTVVKEERWSGTSANEQENIFLGAAYAIKPSAGTTVTFVTGFGMETKDIGSNVSRDYDRTSTSTTADSVTNAVATTNTNYHNDEGVQERWDETTEEMNIPLIVALEHAFNERWTARASVSKDLFYSEEKTKNQYAYTTPPAQGWNQPTSTPNHTQNQAGPRERVLLSSYSTKNEQVWGDSTRVAAGVGYTRGGFTVDTQITANFLTGNNAFGDSAPFGTVTAIYNW